MMYFRSFPRLLRWCLAASLVLAPVVPVAQAGMPAAPDLPVVSEAHALHQAHVVHYEQGQTPDCCAQPDACSGHACAGCAHCTGFVIPWVADFLVPQPLLMSRRSRLHSFSLISLRERPPRLS